MLLHLHTGGYGSLESSRSTECLSPWPRFCGKADPPPSNAKRHLLMWGPSLQGQAWNELDLTGRLCQTRDKSPNAAVLAEVAHIVSQTGPAQGGISPDRSCKVGYRRSQAMTRRDHISFHGDRQLVFDGYR